MLKKWLNSYKSKDGDKHTHLLFNGGKFCIPKDREREFIKIYTECLLKKEKVFVVECRPKIFKFMIDLDIKENITDSSESKWTDEHIEEVVKLIQNVLFEFYEINMNVICCTSPSKIIQAKGTEPQKLKLGIHLIWPRNFIIPSDALILRSAIIQKLISVYGKRTNGNSWEDVVDERVYISNGYRMVGSDKISRDGGRPIVENRVYWPTFVMNSQGEMRHDYYNRLCKDYESLILDTSIRYVPVSVSIPLTKIPKWVTIDKELSTQVKNVKKGSVRVSRIDIGTMEFTKLERFMNDKLPSVYSNQNLKSVQRYPDGNLLIITDSRHCMNIGRDHNSCGIYFLGVRKGIYQKCLCPCINLKDRIFGYCKDFTSSCFEWDPELRESLFPKPKLTSTIEGTGGSVNLSRTQTKKRFCKQLSNFCDDLFDSIGQDPPKETKKKPKAKKK